MSEQETCSHIIIVLGPLIGADLLHLRDVSKISTGIGGAGIGGTFDRIVLSGIVAVYLTCRLPSPSLPDMLSQQTNTGAMRFSLKSSDAMRDSNSTRLGNCSSS